MFGRLLSKEEINGALVLGFAGTIMVLVANGPGPVSLKRMMSRALSNPIPRAIRETHTEDVTFPTTPSKIAA